MKGYFGSKTGGQRRGTNENVEQLAEDATKLERKKLLDAERALAKLRAERS